jgi:AraC-like DNA-binding protein
VAKTKTVRGRQKLIAWIRPYVRQCGDERRPAWHLGERSLLDYLLVYIAEGTGRFTIGGVACEASPGSLFWIPPRTPHEMEGYPPSMVCPYVHFDLIYRPGASDWNFSIPAGMLDLEQYDRLAHPEVEDSVLGALCGALVAHNNRRIDDLIREICAEAARAQPHADLRMSGLMTKILAEVLRGQEGLRGDYGRHAPGLEEAADYIRDHCETGLGMPEVARIAGLSPSHFRKVFALHFGMSPREFQRRSRITKAKQLMLGSTLNASEIAQILGFATVHSFSRAFKDVEGIAPTAYRLRAGPNAWSGLRHPLADE